MAETWLEKTVEIPGAIGELLAKYGTEQINDITSSENYEMAKAALVLSLNLALNKSGGTRRKKWRAAGPMLDQLLNGLGVIFMLGYDQGYKQGQKDRTEELSDLPDGSMGQFSREHGDV